MMVEYIENWVRCDTRGAIDLKIFLRVLAVIYAVAALLHIGSILGFGRIPFAEAPLSWQISDILYGALDLVAAVGLYLSRRWGIWAFFVAAGSEILLFTLVPEWFVVEPEHLTMLRGFVIYHVVALSIYFVLRHRVRRSEIRSENRRV